MAHGSSVRTRLRLQNCFFLGGLKNEVRVRFFNTAEVGLGSGRRARENLVAARGTRLLMLGALAALQFTTSLLCQPHRRDLHHRICNTFETGRCRSAYTGSRPSAMHALSKKGPDQSFLHHHVITRQSNGDAYCGVKCVCSEKALFNPGH